MNEQRSPTYNETRTRVEKQLDEIARLLKPLDPETLSELMDGAQDAVMQWLPREMRCPDCGKDLTGVVSHEHRMPGA